MATSSRDERASARRTLAVLAAIVAASLMLAPSALAAKGGGGGKPGSTSTTDTLAPSIAITSPSAGATVGGILTVSGTAADNVALSKTEFAVDGAYSPAAGT